MLVVIKDHRTRCTYIDDQGLQLVEIDRRSRIGGFLVTVSEERASQVFSQIYRG
jgi:hypothetical protein